MSPRSRAIVSNEWVLALQNGDLTTTYDTVLGDAETIDTIISGIGGDVVLADYRLDDNMDRIEIVGSFDGGAIIDFGLSA